MKKIKLISAFILSLLLVLSTLCYASNTTISSEEDTTNITAGSTNTITLKLNCNSLIGGVMGTIEKSSNVTIDEVTALNGWNLTYNSGNGSFNIVKNEGGKNEDFMKIKYTVASDDGTGKIEVKNITASNIVDYEEEDVDNFTKSITIVKQQENPGNEDPGTQDPGTENPGTEKPAEEKPSSQKDKTPAGNLKPTTTTKQDTTVSNKEINKAGLTIGISGLLVGAVAIGVFAYIKYRKYNGIK